MRALGAVIDWAPFYTRRPPRQGFVLDWARRYGILYRSRNSVRKTQN
jgi:hypothetical protein